MVWMSIDLGTSKACLCDGEKTWKLLMAEIAADALPVSQVCRQLQTQTDIER